MLSGKIHWQYCNLHYQSKYWLLLWHFYINDCTFTFVEEPLVCYMVQKNNYMEHSKPEKEQHLINKKHKIMEPVFKEKGWL